MQMTNALADRARAVLGHVVQIAARVCTVRYLVIRTVPSSQVARVRCRREGFG